MDTLKFTAMPFGLTNAPAVFMELMSRDDHEVTEGREDVREVFQQRGSGAKRKLSRCRRNQMGNEPILALPEGADDFVVYYDARSKDLEACLEKGRNMIWHYQKLGDYHSRLAVWMGFILKAWSGKKVHVVGCFFLFGVVVLLIAPCGVSKSLVVDSILDVSQVMVDKTLGFVKGTMMLGPRGHELKGRMIALVEVRWRFEAWSELLRTQGSNGSKCPPLFYDRVSPRVVKSRTRFLSMWGYCDNHDLCSWSTTVV
ncbi:hypothetical protein Tco_0843651 [Tanacetum coccineum]|uniref:Uncharacterized protein n=1 Tax=Tanacetum coccineum TaxID=301880 RepID=A0ABQ5B8H2_9ASTR